MRVQKIINEAFLILKKNKIKSALLDCEILMSLVLKKNRKFIILNPNHEIMKKTFYILKI